MSRRTAAVLGVGLLVLTVALGVVAAIRPPLPLPVLLDLGGRRLPVEGLEGVSASLVPPALVAVLLLLRASGAIRRPLAVLALGAAEPIAVFVVARLNGVVDVGALVLVYAATAGSVLLLALQRPGGSPLPMRFESVLAVVPWGVIALEQVGRGVIGDPPSIAIRVLTLVVLAASIAGWIDAYRRRDGPGRETAGFLRAGVPALLLALGVVLAVA